jgi:hypothetical protein
MTIIKYVFFTLAFTLVCALICVAQAQVSKESDGPESTSCPAAQTFTFGSGPSKFAFCISNHGNIQNLEFPATFKHISLREGYAVCSANDTVVHGFDSGTAEDGWGPPSATQPGGPHTFPLTITRNSTDGKVQLQQTFDWDTLRKDIIITMVVKNTSAAALSNVFLARYYDGDTDNDNSDDLYGGDGDSIWGHDTNQRGLRLSVLSYGIKHYTFVEEFLKWSPIASGPQTGRHCFAFESRSVPTPPGDYIGRITYSLGTLNAGQSSKKAIVLYGRL